MVKTQFSQQQPYLQFALFQRGKKGKTCPGLSYEIFMKNLFSIVLWYKIEIGINL